jgi:hypothetical protein
MPVAAFEAVVVNLPGLVAAGDLTLKQYTWVRLTEVGQVNAITADTQQPFGVLQNAPAQGQAAQVAVDGVTFMKAGGTIDASANANIGPTTDGSAVARVIGTDVTKYRAAIALSDAASGDIFAAQLITPSLAVTGN